MKTPFSFEFTHVTFAHKLLKQTRIVSLELFLDVQVYDKSRDTSVSTPGAAGPLRCQQLIGSDRVWDFSDVFIEACMSFGSLKACDKVFGPAEDQPLQCLLENWTTTEPDESTLLALLNIFASMALYSTGADRQNESFTRTCLNYADKIGDSLLQKFPETLKSGPVLLWTLTKSAIFVRTQKGENNPDNPLQHGYLDNYAGVTYMSSFHCMRIPYYVPVYQEIPGWKPPHLPAKCSTLVKMVLEAAKERDDFKLQAFCLQELAMRSQNPSGLLSELADLQKNKQLDMQGYLLTCLSKYLTCSDLDSTSRLRIELSDFGWWDNPSDLLIASRAAARDTILRALTPSSDGGQTLSLKAALRYYQHLDVGHRQAIDAYVPISLDGRDPRDLDSSSRAGADASLVRERDEMKRELAQTRQQLEELRKSASQKDGISVDNALYGRSRRRSLVTSSPRVRERPSDRPNLVGDQSIPMVASEAAGDWGKGPPKARRQKESEEQAPRATSGDKHGVPRDEISRDHHDIYTRNAVRPRLAIEGPPEPSNLGPTVEEVSDIDRQRPPEPGEVDSERGLSPGGNSNKIDTASQPTRKRSVSSPPIGVFRDTRFSATHTSEDDPIPLVLRQRGVRRVEQTRPRPRSPSSVVAERIVTDTRERSISPSPSPENDRVRLGTRYVERLERSPNPLLGMEHIYINDIERERDRSSSPSSSSYSPEDIERSRIIEHREQPREPTASICQQVSNDKDDYDDATSNHAF